MTGPRDSDVVAQVAEQFTRAFWRMRRDAAKELAPFGITFAQARVLRVLGHAPHALRIGDLATRLGIVPRSATAMVDLLEEAGLAVRGPAPGDRRSVLVSLTAEGRVLLDRMGEARRAGAEELLARLDGSQLAQLRGLLEVLNATDDPHECAAS